MLVVEKAILLKVQQPTHTQSAARSYPAGPDDEAVFHSAQTRLYGAVLPVLVLSGVLLGSMAYLGLRTELHLGDLTRDVASSAGLPFYYGLYSNVGVLLWWTAAVICIGSAILLWPSRRLHEPATFLLFAGITTTVIALDDLFQFHEDLLPNYLGLPEELFFAIHGLLLAVLLVRWRHLIMRSEWGLLLSALALFGTSVVIDALDLRVRGRFFWEDGLKLAGIVCWLGYFGRLSWLYLRQIMAAVR
jgi:hypothetical protein